MAGDCSTSIEGLCGCTLLCQNFRYAQTTLGLETAYFRVDNKSNARGRNSQIENQSKDPFTHETSVLPKLPVAYHQARFEI
jgi:hypothetical protein